MGLSEIDGVESKYRNLETDAKIRIEATQTK